MRLQPDGILTRPEVEQPKEAGAAARKSGEVAVTPPGNGGFPLESERSHPGVGGEVSRK